jgi:hypothetical protein
MREGAIVDVTIVEPAQRLRKIIEVVPEDRSEEEPSSDTPTSGYIKQMG